MRFRHSCIALMLAAGAAVADPIPGSTFRIGNWEGGAYGSEGSGAFTHCGISAGYVTGDVLHFTVNRQATVTVAVTSPALAGIPVGESFPVVLHVDRRPPFHGSATVLADGFAALEVTDFDRALESFMRGYTLTVRGAGREGRYDLTGTFRALGATMDCAARYFDHAPTHTQPDRTAAFQLATTVLTGLGIRDFRFLSQGELEEMGQPDSVAWTAPEHGLFGWSLLVPRSPGQYGLRDTDPADTAYLARKCGGDYATSSRSIPLPDGNAARELRLICQEEGGATEHLVSKFFAGDLVVYNALTFVAPRRDRPAGWPPSRWSEEATLRAAGYFTDAGR